MTAHNALSEPLAAPAPQPRIIRGSSYLVRNGGRLAARDEPEPAHPRILVARPKAQLREVGYRLRAAIKSGEF